MSMPRSSRPLALLCAAFWLVSAPALAQSSRPPVRVEALEGDYVTLGRTNVREQPSQQGARLGVLDSGARVRVTGKVADAPWYAIQRDNGRPGYVFADLLRAEEPKPASPPAPVAEPAAPAPTPAPTPAPDPVATALSQRLDKMEAALGEIRDQLKGTSSTAERQQALEKAIEALRADLAARPPAGDAERTDGIVDRVLKLQEQIAAQITEQRAELERLARRMEKAEEWLKPLRDWSEKQWDETLRPTADGWAAWLWSGYAGVRDWIAGWWSKPPAPAPTQNI